MTQQQRALDSESQRPVPEDGQIGLWHVVAARWQLLLEEWAISLHHRTAEAIELRQKLAAEMIALPDLVERRRSPGCDQERGGTHRFDVREAICSSGASITLGEVLDLRFRVWFRDLQNGTILRAISTQKQQLATETLLRECDSLSDPVDQIWLNGRRPDFEVCVDDSIIERMALTALVHFGPIQRHRTGPDWATWVATLETRLPRYIVAEIVCRTTELLSTMRGVAVTPYTYETASDNLAPERSGRASRQI